MSHPLVTIIIPSYNSRQYLKESVQSAIAQTYSPIEIILINDGSTDDTTELFPEFEKKGVICLTQANAGASSARNTGLAIATGEYIQFLDADDVLHPDKIERQISKMLACNADLSFTQWGNFVDNEANADDFRFKHIDLSSIVTGRDILYSFGANNWFILTVAWLVKRELIMKAGYWNPFKCPNDDGEYFSRILFWSRKVSVIESKLAYYRQTPETSLSDLNTEAKALSSLHSWQLIHALMMTTGDTTLLGYPKKGFYVNYLFTRQRFPLVARQSAREFDKIKVPFFLDRNRKVSWILKLFGLHYGKSVLRVLARTKSITNGETR